MLKNPTFQGTPQYRKLFVKLSIIKKKDFVNLENDLFLKSCHNLHYTLLHKAGKQQLYSCAINRVSNEDVQIFLLGRSG